MCPMLNDLQKDKLARIVKIEESQELKEKLALKGIFEGSILRVISSYGAISFQIEGRTFIISRGFAEKIRVIEINLS